MGGGDWLQVRMCSQIWLFLEYLLHFLHRLDEPLGF